MGCGARALCHDEETTCFGEQQAGKVSVKYSLLKSTEKESTKMQVPSTPQKI